MYAHFEQHVYHRHSHETYSLGVTEQGAQTFTCRGTTHVSGAGMVMAFNPDDPHDGHATDQLGFTYRMLHVSQEQVLETLSGLAGHPAAAPLFAEPVVRDERLAQALRALHLGLVNGSSSLSYAASCSPLPLPPPPFAPQRVRPQPRPRTATEMPFRSLSGFATSSTPLTRRMFIPPISRHLLVEAGLLSTARFVTRMVLHPATISASSGCVRPARC